MPDLGTLLQTAWVKGVKGCGITTLLPPMKILDYLLGIHENYKHRFIYQRGIKAGRMLERDRIIYVILSSYSGIRAKKRVADFIRRMP